MSIPAMITVLVILLIMSSFFSASETAFTSFNRTRVKNMADDGNKKAALVTKRQKGANLFSKENTIEVLSLREGINPRRQRWQ